MDAKPWSKPVKELAIYLTSMVFVSLLIFHGVTGFEKNRYKQNPSFTSSNQHVTLETALRTDLGVSTHDFWGKEPIEAPMEMLSETKPSITMLANGLIGEKLTTTPIPNYPSGVRLNTPGRICTSGFAAKRNGQPVVVTAKHCIQAVQNVSSDLISAQIDADHEVTLGTVPDQETFGDIDIAIIPVKFKSNSYMWNVYSNTEIEPTTSTLNKGGYNSLKDKVTAYTGEKVCSYGVTSGWRCGLVTDVNPDGTLVKTDFCSRGGDSGGPLFSARGLVGIVVVSYLKGDDRLPCRDGRRAEGKPGTGIVPLSVLPDNITFN